MPKIKITWEGNMNFKGYDDAGREVMMDAASIYGGKNSGIRPMQLLLISLGGCAAIEVGHILNKMRIEYEGIQVEVEGERAEKPPRVFTNIKLRLKFSGEQLSCAKIEKAINLGVINYCSVANMINKACTIELQYEFNGNVYVYSHETGTFKKAG